MRASSVLVGLAAVALFATSRAFAEDADDPTDMEIRVAPQTFVLSSSGGKLTVHANVPYVDVDKKSVVLKVDGEEVLCHTFADNLGNLVAQCTKEAAAEAIDDFEGKTATVTVTLTAIVDDTQRFGSETILVKK